MKETKRSVIATIVLVITIVIMGGGLSSCSNPSSSRSGLADFIASHHNFWQVYCSSEVGKVETIVPVIIRDGTVFVIMGKNELKMATYNVIGEEFKWTQSKKSDIYTFIDCKGLSSSDDMTIKPHNKNGCKVLDNAALGMQFHSNEVKEDTATP